MVSEQYQLPISVIYDELKAKIVQEFNRFDYGTIARAARKWKTPTLHRDCLNNDDLRKIAFLPLEEYLRITDETNRDQLRAIARIDIGQLVDQYSTLHELAKSDGIKQLIGIFAPPLYPMMERGICK